jgi:hypothetical protein
MPCGSRANKRVPAKPLEPLDACRDLGLHGVHRVGGAAEAAQFIDHDEALQVVEVKDRSHPRPPIFDVSLSADLRSKISLLAD